MINNITHKKKAGTFISYIFILLLMAFAFPLSALAEAGKVSLAVYPFNDIRRGSLDMDITAFLNAEFAGYEFIEIVPVEVIREKLYEIEPQFMWTGKEGSVKEGGILWKIEDRIVEKINQAVNAQYSVYGDLLGYGERWSIDAFLVREGESEPFKSFTLSGMKHDEFPSKLKGMSKDIAALLGGAAVLDRAEEEIRQYKGGMISYSFAVGNMKKHITGYPESVPLRALLLDLYLEDKEKNREGIMSEGMRIIDLLKQPEGAETRYLLSLALDPYDAVAGEYERKGEWEKAIAVRERALGSFPYNMELHKEGMGKDHYFLARSLEEKGERGKASLHFEMAITYLGPTSLFFREASEGAKRLKGREAASD